METSGHAAALAVPNWAMALVACLGLALTVLVVGSWALAAWRFRRR